MPCIATHCCARRIREISMHCDPLDVFDFDGTLIRGNSFTQINKLLLVSLLRAWRIRSIVGVLVHYAARRLGLASHLKFKRYIVGVFENALPEDEKARICQFAFDENVNTHVLDRMLGSPNCVISTAAPHAYISRISLGRKVPIISSIDPHNDYPDTGNFGPGKALNLTCYFRGRSICVNNFFTDNPVDDKSLVDLSTHAYVVENNSLVKIK